jgi:hypothetical protein
MLNSLNTNPAYNIELIPFFDIGTTWTQGNPLSQKNPIDTEVINSYPLTITVQTLKSPFLMGFGAGTRLQMFGYSSAGRLGLGRRRLHHLESTSAPFLGKKLLIRIRT